MTRKKTSKPRKKPRKPATDPKLKRAIRVSDDDWADWQDAAELEGVRISAWVRALVGPKSRRVLNRHCTSGS